MRQGWFGRTALALALLVAGGARAWAPSGEVRAQLAEGRPWAEVLPQEGGAGLIHAAIDIPVPPRIVWEVMTDCRLAQRLVSTVTSCKVLSGDWQRGWDVREQVTRGTFFVPEIRNVLRADYEPYSLIRFHKAGGSLKSEEGEWRLEPIDGGAGARVIYVNKVAVDVLAPASLVRAVLKRDMSKVLINLRRESLAAELREKT